MLFDADEVKRTAAFWIEYGTPENVLQISEELRRVMQAANIGLDELENVKSTTLFLPPLLILEDKGIRSEMEAEIVASAKKEQDAKNKGQKQKKSEALDFL